MSAVVLLTAADCHLCEHGKAVLDELGVDWREVDAASEEGRTLEATAPPMRPVLFTSDGRVLAYGRLSLKRLRKQLDESRRNAGRRARAGGGQD
jgi:glutaredoxin